MAVENGTVGGGGNYVIDSNVQCRHRIKNNEIMLNEREYRP